MIFWLNPDDITHPCVELVGEMIPLALVAASGPKALEAALDVVPELRDIVADLRRALPSDATFKSKVMEGDVKTFTPDL